MSQEYYDVRDFHLRFGLPCPETPVLAVERHVQVFRVKFLYEETLEYLTALDTKDLPAQADALVDLSYVSIGTGLFLGADSIGWATCPPPSPSACPALADQSGWAFGEEVLWQLHVLFYRLNRQETMTANILLRDLHRLTLTQASRQRLPWGALWAEVQRANMAKVRVEAPAGSKRKSRFDVVKPADWVGPDIVGVLRAHGWEG